MLYSKSTFHRIIFNIFVLFGFLSFLNTVDANSLYLRYKKEKQESHKLSSEVLIMEINTAEHERRQSTYERKNSNNENLESSSSVKPLFSEAIKKLNSLTKDTFETTKSFRNRRNNLLDELENNALLCIENGLKCFSAGIAQMDRYDADKEEMVLYLDWDKNIQKLLRESQAITKVTTSIPREDARRIFGKTNKHYFHVKLKYLGNKYRISTILLYGKYKLRFNRSILRKIDLSDMQRLPENLQNVLDGWNAANNTQDTTSLSTLYATRVVYYGKEVSYDKAVRDKKRAFGQYPNFSQKIANIKYDKLSDDYYKITFDKYVKNNRESAEKKYPSYLYVKSFEGNWHIVEEGDTVTDVNLKRNTSGSDTGLSKEPVRKYVQSKEYSGNEALGGSAVQNRQKTAFFQENGVEIYIQYPSKVVVGENFVINATLVNNYGRAKQGGLTLSFPDFSSLAGKVLKNNFHKIDAYAYPQKIWNKRAKRALPTDYFMIEGWHNRTWHKGVSKSFTVEMKAPESIGQLRVNIRGLLWIHNSHDTRRVPSGGLIYDQQGFAVKQIMINLVGDNAETRVSTVQSYDNAQRYRFISTAKVVNIRYNDTLAIRTMPTTNSRRLGGLPPSAANIGVFECKQGRGGKWCKIYYDGMIGWSYAKYLRFY